MGTHLGRFPALGPIRGLARVLSEQRPDVVVVALSADQHSQILSILNECEKHHVPVKVVPDLYEMTLNRVHSNWLPNLAGAEHETVLAQIALKAVDGNVEGSLRDLVIDTAYWRRVLTGASTLVSRSPRFS